MFEISSLACLRLGEQLAAMAMSDMVDGVAGLVDKNKMSVTIIALSYLSSKLDVLVDNDPDVANLVEAAKARFRLDFNRQYEERMKD